MSLTVGSLFSGIGGLDLGLERAGMTVKWQCEIDPYCRRVLARHWADIPCYEDVSTLDRPPAVDVLCGGFPCQDVSVAGRRAGLAGARSGLFFEFVRVAAALAPRWVLIENVPGLLSSNDGRDMGTVVGALVDLGYGVAWRILDAQYFGVAQRRRRVFIVGCAGNPARAAQILFEPESCDRDTPPRRETGTRVAASRTAGTATGRGVNPTGRRQEDDINLVATLQGGGKRGYRVDAEGAAGNQLIAFHVTQDPISGPVALVAYNPYRTLEKDGTVTSGFAARPVIDALHGPTGNKEPLVVAAYAVDIGEHKKQNGSGVSVEIHPTLDTYSNRAVVNAMQVRRLTPTECERLQGFPDGWTDGETDSARYRMLGNAVCVPVAEWIATRIKEAA